MDLKDTHQVQCLPLGKKQAKLWGGRSKDGTNNKN
jgi:hypothetical protein